MPTRLLNIHCFSCEALVVEYQKKGSGALLRLYLDRISGPNYLTTQIKNKDNPTTLHCPKCSARLGSLSKKTSPQAYRLVSGSFRKKEKG